MLPSERNKKVRSIVQLLKDKGMPSGVMGFEERPEDNKKIPGTESVEVGDLAGTVQAAAPVDSRTLEAIADGKTLELTKKKKKPSPPESPA